MVYNGYLGRTLSRREWLRYTGALGLLVAGGSLLAACETDDDDEPDDIEEPDDDDDVDPVDDPDDDDDEPADDDVDEEPDAPDDERYGGDFVAAMETPPPTLDLMTSTTAATREQAWFTIESLLAVNEEFEPDTLLAESWEVSDDGLTYTFPLRQGVLFHNGDEMVADDVIASMDRLLEVTNRPAAFAIIEDYTAEDDYTVSYTLREPSGAFIGVMAFPLGYAGVFPREVIDAVGSDELTADDMVGTGPYKLVEWVPDQRLRYERFEDYEVVGTERDGLRGAKHPYFDTITLEAVPETASRVAGLETAEYDYAQKPSTTDFEGLEANPDTEAQIYEYAFAYVFTFNHAWAPTDNLQFRQAIQAAIDVNTIGLNAANGMEEFFTTDHSIFFPPTPWHNDEGADLYNQNDEDRARELLEESGYDGEEVILLTNRNYDDMFSAIVTLEQQLESKLGMNVSVEVLDWPGQQARTEETDGWNIAVTWFASPATFGPDGWAAFFTGDSLGHYANEEMDAIFDQLSTAETLEERVELAADMQRVFYETIPMLKLHNGFSMDGLRSNIRDFQIWYQARFWGVWRD